MDNGDLQSCITSSFVRLADVLEALDATRWDTPSLCEGWRVREVIAHLTMPARYDEATFMTELQADDFDFERLSNRIATRDAELPTSSLVANLRDDKLHTWTPPGGGAHGALNHITIHGLDVTVPLGVARCTSDDCMRVVLDDLTAGSIHAHFGTSIEGRTLRATDIDWSYGTGRELTASAADLALHLCGRSIPTPRLRGAGLDRAER